MPNVTCLGLLMLWESLVIVDKVTFGPSLELGSNVTYDAPGKALDVLLDRRDDDGLHLVEKGEICWVEFSPSEAQAQLILGCATSTSTHTIIFVRSLTRGGSHFETGSRVSSFSDFCDRSNFNLCFLTQSPLDRLEIWTAFAPHLVLHFER
ncbi:hypothetical protein PIB30_009441 [Stylosanthes scabra]|uniref:Uncharacterized protein n=1 Tax=Stylosanthes scabra TaxID=79078 RepID=A0ABU6X331_9FABA|nr:hypothetical protein [Stylosanthes scabra]